MQKYKSRFTIFFEDPFWVGVYERANGDELEVCKITFGSQPKDCEVYERLLLSWSGLVFSEPVYAEMEPETKRNPKRVQRAITKQLAAPVVGTKAQQAIQLQREQGKAARKKKSRQEREREKERRFAQRQAKKTQKHKGH